MVQFLLILLFAKQIVADADDFVSKCAGGELALTIGGIFHTASTAEYFGEVVTDLSRVMPPGYCLKAE